MKRNATKQNPTTNNNTPKRKDKEDKEEETGSKTQSKVDVNKITQQTMNDEPRSGNPRVSEANMTSTSLVTNISVPRTPAFENIDEDNDLAFVTDAFIIDTSPKNAALGETTIKSGSMLQSEQILKTVIWMGRDE